MATEPKPTLHEIAAMPFPESVKAMRKHYNPEWGKPVPEGAIRRKYKVEVEYDYRSTETEVVEVEAFSEEEAEDKASDLVGSDLPWDAEVDIRNTRVLGTVDRAMGQSPVGQRREAALFMTGPVTREARQAPKASQPLDTINHTGERP